MAFDFLDDTPGYHIQNITFYNNIYQLMQLSSRISENLEDQIFFFQFIVWYY